MSLDNRVFIAALCKSPTTVEVYEYLFYNRKPFNYAVVSPNRASGNGRLSYWGGFGNPINELLLSASIYAYADLESAVHDTNNSGTDINVIFLDDNIELDFPINLTSDTIIMSYYSLSGPLSTYTLKSNNNDAGLKGFTIAILNVTVEGGTIESYIQLYVGHSFYHPYRTSFQVPVVGSSLASSDSALPPIYMNRIASSQTRIELINAVTSAQSISNAESLQDLKIGLIENSEVTTNEFSSLFILVNPFRPAVYHWGFTNSNVDIGSFGDTNITRTSKIDFVSGSLVVRDKRPPTADMFRRKHPIPSTQDLSFVALTNYNLMNDDDKELLSRVGTYSAYGENSELYLSSPINVKVNDIEQDYDLEETDGTINVVGKCAVTVKLPSAYGNGNKGRLYNITREMSESSVTLVSSIGIGSYGKKITLPMDIQSITLQRSTNKWIVRDNSKFLMLPQK